eukprot:g4506.t1
MDDRVAKHALGSFEITKITKADLFKAMRSAFQSPEDTQLIEEVRLTTTRQFDKLVRELRTQSADALEQQGVNRFLRAAELHAALREERKWRTRRTSESDRQGDDPMGPALGPSFSGSKNKREDKKKKKLDSPGGATTVFGCSSSSSTSSSTSTSSGGGSRKKQKTDASRSLESSLDTSSMDPFAFAED